MAYSCQWICGLETAADVGQCRPMFTLGLAIMAIGSGPVLVGLVARSSGPDQRLVGPGMAIMVVGSMIFVIAPA